MEPVLDGCFPRLAFVGDILDKTARIQPQPFGEGNIFIIQLAALLCFLPELIVVCHFTTTVFYYKEKTSTNQDYKEDDYGT